MRGWIAATVAAFGGWLILEGVVSAFVTSDVAARPVVALVREGAGGTERIPVWRRERIEEVAPPPDQARFYTAEGVSLGMRMTFLLPDGGKVICTQRVVRLGCRDGWRAERAP
jgi:hypothetical protein